MGLRSEENFLLNLPNKPHVWWLLTLVEVIPEECPHQKESPFCRQTSQIAYQPPSIFHKATDWEAVGRRQAWKSGLSIRAKCEDSTDEDTNKVATAAPPE